MGFLDKILPPGKMTIELEKLEFHPGDSVNGTVKLEMKKSMPARALKAKVFGQEIIKKRSGGKTSTEMHTIFDFEKELSGEREYRTEEFQFQITIPTNVLEKNTPQLEGTAATAVAAIGMLTGSSQSRRIEWRVEAKLDVPGGLDISNKVKINVA